MKKLFSEAFNFDENTLKSIYEIRDNIGAKKSNVWFYSKTGENNPVWTQILPTPYVRDIEQEVTLQEGGSLEHGDIILQNLPRYKFSEEDLETSSDDDNTEKYWVIDGRAYTTVFIKKGLVSFDVHIRRYDSINKGELVPPSEEEDYMLVHKKIVFQIPQTATQRLNVPLANVPSFYNIPQVEGDGLEGYLVPSSNGGIARLTFLKDGYFTLVLQDEIEFMRSNAGTGSDGEFITAISQYDRNGQSLRSWVSEHPITDPISSEIKVPIEKDIPLTPCSEGDYLNINFAFSTNLNNRYLEFSLPADNPGLDERIEIFFYENVRMPAS